MNSLKNPHLQGHGSKPLPVKQAGNTPPHRLSVAQPKTATTSQMKKQPVAPAVYRPQPVVKTAQGKLLNAAQNQRLPIAPPAYRPQALQPKMSVGSQVKKLPVAPPVYRPQPRGTALQPQMAQARPPVIPSKVNAARQAAPPVYRPQNGKAAQPKMASAPQVKRQPVAPPVYRLEQKKIVQPKIFAQAAARRPPVAPPVYRPEPGPVQAKLAPRAQTAMQISQSGAAQPKLASRGLRVAQPKPTPSSDQGYLGRVQAARETQTPASSSKAHTKPVQAKYPAHPKPSPAPSAKRSMWPSAAGASIQRTKWLAREDGWLEQITDLMDDKPSLKMPLNSPNVPPGLGIGDIWDDATQNISRGADRLNQIFEGKAVHPKAIPKFPTAVEFRRDYMGGKGSLPPGAEDEHQVELARRQIIKLDNPHQRDEAIVALNRLMLNEQVYSYVAEDPDLFGKIFHRVKAPNIDKGYRFSSDPHLDKAKREQEIHSVYDQLHYVLHRTGSARGLAHQLTHVEKAGTEVNFNLTASTARDVQYDALAKLILLHAGEEVRMPVYTHRYGPMLGGLLMHGGHMSWPDYNKKAAQNMNSLLTSTDEIGANVRVTEADRGLGAYISTDSDNYYGPHGVAFDPRDVHILPLSSQSLDNKLEVSSERTKHLQHQFRATGKPIPLAQGGKPKYAEIFVSTHDDHPQLLTTVLSPQDMTQGVLSNVKEELLRGLFRSSMAPVWRANPQVAVGSQPMQIITGGKHEQPKSNEQVYLMRQLVQELNGLYEPHTWTTLWKDNPQVQLMNAMSERINLMMPSISSNSSKSKEVEDDEWTD